MKLSKPGKSTSSISVENITPFGIWLLVDDVEYYLNYKDFPWFLDKPIKAIFNVEKPQPNHLYWPDLDVDLELDSIISPEKYPLFAH